MTQPPQPPEESWPTPEDPTVISHPETVVGAPPPPGPPPDRRVGAGMLLGLGAVALVAVGILLAYLLTHRDKDKAVTTTVVATVPSNDQATTSAATTAATTPAQATTTSAATTTSPATTTPPIGMTTPAPPSPQDVSMPDVSGQKEPGAVQAMGKVGILASLFFVPSQDPLGTVVQQAKPAGTTVPFHSHVQINLSKGPNSTATAQVPDVIGQTLTQAVTTVNGAHLRLIYLKFPVTDRTQAGKIVQQSPLGGGQAPQNAQVLVYLGAFRVK